MPSHHHRLTSTPLPLHRTPLEKGELLLFHRGKAFSNAAEIREAAQQPCSTMAASHLQSKVQLAWSDVEDWQSQCTVSYDSSMI